jgi:hypothetical protein
MEIFSVSNGTDVRIILVPFLIEATTIVKSFTIVTPPSKEPSITKVSPAVYPVPELTIFTSYVVEPAFLRTFMIAPVPVPPVGVIPACNT